MIQGHFIILRVDRFPKLDSRGWVPEAIARVLSQAGRLSADELEANPLLAQLTGGADHWGRTAGEGVGDRKM